MLIDKDTLQRLRVEMNAALAPIAARHGLAKLNATNCTYDKGGNFTFKVEGLVTGGKSKEAQEYDAIRAFYPKLPALDSMVKLGSAREDYIVRGKRRSTVICERVSNGKSYLFKFEPFKVQFKAELADA